MPLATDIAFAVGVLALLGSRAPAALKLLQVGESNRDERLDVPELAAWTMVASTILNLDEAVTKN